MSMLLPQSCQSKCKDASDVIGVVDFQPSKQAEEFQQTSVHTEVNLQEEVDDHDLE